MASIRSICPHCGRIVPARQRCSCRPVPKVDERARDQRQQYRKAYRTGEYQRNRRKRFALAGGRCESCGEQLVKGWECDHVIPLRQFADPHQGNAIDNLRVLCKRCHSLKHR